MTRVRFLAGMIVVAAVWSAPAEGAAPAPARAAEELFERQVRPVFVAHCQSCHGQGKQRGGLRLDSAEGLRKGGDSGAVVVPGSPEKSLLVQVIRHDGPVKMPPKAKLPPAAVEAIAAWVKAGAPWPGGSVAPKPTGKDHWAFRPVGAPTVPVVKNHSWVATPIDAFILARLEKEGLAPSSPADRRTLLRRANIDLTGLPPTPDEVAAFEADASPDAWEKVVERLLASPHYGERWGRHWLDVARYADTKGYVRLAENPRYPCAWTYRDYVIRAFNEDLPYDRFILEQLAADLLPLGADKRPLAAMGFLTLGQRFLNNQPDIIDDRIDVVMRGLQGLTVACARCHDHKFDPVPTADYYSLYGVFASSLEPRVPPVVAAPGDGARHAGYLKELQARAEKFEGFLREQHARLTESFRARSGEYLLAAQKEAVQANFVAVMFLIDAAKDLNPVVTQRWGRFLEQTRKSGHPVLGPWNELARLTPTEFAARSQLVLGGAGLNPVVVAALREGRPRDLTAAARIYGELFAQADRRWQDAQRRDSHVRKLDDPAWEEVRRVLYGPGAPPDVPPWDIEDCFFVDTTVQNQFHAQQRLVEDWVATPGAAPHAHTLIDCPVLYEPHVFIRGNSSNPGANVPRQFLGVLTRGPRRPFTQGSGRLELAHAIASGDNPLTARVMVNRMWMHHFGEGLVRTPGDFGARGEAPTHPELLDYLARRLIDDGWSVKRLHRLVLLSSTYRQASADSPRGRERDPDNRLLWRMKRRRLDWEALRDTLLAVSGGIARTMGGPSVDLLTRPFPARRTVYGVVDRQSLPGDFRVFDFPAPDASTARRHETTVPQQALFLMNSPFLKEQARRLATRPDVLALTSPSQRIDRLHRLLYGRAALPDEVALGVRYLEAAPSTAPGALSAWEEYAQVLLLANELTFID